MPWYHHLALLDKLRIMDDRRWYAAKAIEHNWSRNVLVMQIETRARGIELKAGPLKPEHVGQLGFYLEALDRDVKKPHENPTRPAS